MTLKIKLLALFLIPFSFLVAQNSEIRIPNYAEEFSPILLGKDGLFVTYETKTEKKRDIQINFISYDTNMVELSKQNVVIPSNMDNNTTYYSSITKTLYLIYYDFLQMSTLKHKYKLITYNAITKELLVTDGRFPMGFWPGDFFVVNRSLYMKQPFKNWHKINLDDNTMKDFDFGLGENLSQYTLIEDEEQKVISQVFFDETTKSGYKIRNFGAGKDNKVTLITPEKNYLSDITIKSFDKNNKVAFGTYNKKLLDDATIQLISENYEFQVFRPIDGFYFSRFENNTPVVSTFLPYKLPSTDYIKKKKPIVGDKTEINRASLTTVLKINNTYILSSSIFISKYEAKIIYGTKTSVSYSNKVGKAPSFSERTTKTIQLAHVEDEADYELIMACDENGNIIWRDSFDISSAIKRIMVGGFLNFEKSVLDGSYYVYYFEENELKCKHITDKGVVDAVIKPNSNSTSHKKDGSDISRRLHWYDRSYIIYTIDQKGNKLMVERY